MPISSNTINVRIDETLQSTLASFIQDNINGVYTYNKSINRTDPDTGEINIFFYNDDTEVVAVTVKKTGVNTLVEGDTWEVSIKPSFGLLENGDNILLENGDRLIL